MTTAQYFHKLHTMLQWKKIMSDLYHLFLSMQVIKILAVMDKSDILLLVVLQTLLSIQLRYVFGFRTDRAIQYKLV